MKKFLINKIMEKIRIKENYDATKLAEIKYGLETLYLNITKTIVIFGIAYLLNLLKELLLILLFYGLLRLTGFGLHTKKTWQCWITSGVIFILFPYLVKILVMNDYIKIIICIISVVLIAIYAPSDTEKRPLINKKKRKLFKSLCILTAIILAIYSFITKNRLIENSIVLSLILECTMILPISYKIFKLKYANYKYYKKALTA